MVEIALFLTQCRCYITSAVKNTYDDHCMAFRIHPIKYQILLYREMPQILSRLFIV